MAQRYHNSFPYLLSGAYAKSIGLTGIDLQECVQEAVIWWWGTRQKDKILLRNFCRAWKRRRNREKLNAPISIHDLPEEMLATEDKVLLGADLEIDRAMVAAQLLKEAKKKNGPSMARYASYYIGGQDEAVRKLMRRERARVGPDRRFRASPESLKRVLKLVRRYLRRRFPQLEF